MRRDLVRGDAGPQVVEDVQPTPGARFRRWSAEAAPDVPFPPGAHAAVEIAWVDEGQVSYAIGARHYEAPRGQAMLVPSGVEHTTIFGGAMRASAVWISPDFVREVAEILGRSRGPAIGLIPEGERIASLGRVLSDETRSLASGRSIVVDGILDAIVAIALRAEDPRRSTAPRDPAIASAVRFIEEGYAEPLRVDDMARSARMSRFHFSRNFREQTGKSPYRYLVDVRLERAAELMRRGRVSVTEVALSVGFSDPSRFAKMFRGRFGVSPTQALAEGRRKTCYSIPGDLSPPR